MFLLIISISMIVYSVHFTINLSLLHYKYVQEGIFLLLISFVFMFSKKILELFKKIYHTTMAVYKIIVVLLLLIGFTSLIIYFVDNFIYWLIIFNITAFLSYIIMDYIFNKQKSDKSSINNKVNNIDNPLEDINEDCLSRVNFTRSIFEQIKVLENNSNVRIGICGEWGSGKTSVMNFINRLCIEEASYPTVFFRTWQFSNSSEAWIAFVNSIEKALEGWQGNRIETFKNRRYIKNIVTTVKRVILPDNKISNLLNELVLSKVEAKLEITKEYIATRLQEILQKQGNDKKLIVFIDDLDRADINVANEMLMFINEIVNISGIIYIMGVDIDQLVKVVKPEYNTDGKKYLEKIFNITFNLPLVEIENKSKLLCSFLKSINSKLNINSILNIVNVLPTNPREFKKFLYLLDIKVKAHLSNRYLNNDLQWEIIYLGQLLEYRFPNVYNDLYQNDDLIEDMTTGLFMDSMDDRENGENSNLVKSLKILKDKCDKNGVKEEKDIDWIIDIYKLIRDYTHQKFIGISEFMPNSKTSLLFHLNIFNANTSTMTFKEYSETLDNITSEDKNVMKNNVKDWLENKSISDSYKSGFIIHLIRDRTRKFSNAIEEAYENEIIIKLNEVTKITEIIEEIINVDFIYGALLNLEIFNIWMENIKYHANFIYPEYYMQIKDYEKRITLVFVSKLHENVVDIIETLKHDDMDVIERDWYKDLRNEIYSSLENQLINYLIDLFKVEDGINKLWGHSSHRVEKSYLFKDNVLFFNENTFKHIRDIANDANKSRLIRFNFLEYFRLLCYLLTEGRGQFDYDEVKSIFTNHYEEFVDIIWNCILSERMNRRMIGSIEQYRMKVIEITGKQDILPVPKWWYKITNEK